MQEVIIISGPTAAGKSARALALARELDAEIISCDSIQVYKHMDIGSAKPSKAELAEIRHHLIDVCDPSEQYNVDAYIHAAKAALADIGKRNKRVIVAGGSGFYLKAWFSAVTDDIPIPEKIKKEVKELAKNPDEMLAALMRLDPNAPNIIDIKNPRRIRPALERAMASGLTLGELVQKFASLPCPLGNFSKKFELLDMCDEELFARAETRIKNMVSDGLIDETRKLISLKITENPSAAMAIGYRETINAIDKNDFLTLEADILKNTISLIKKQRKFFRNALFKHA